MKEIPLGHGRFAKVDDEDFDRLASFSWRVGAKGYAMGRMGASWKSAPVYLHRVIGDPPEGMHIDHANGDKLDCTRANLRHCTRSQNMANRPKSRSTRGGSKYKGAYREHGARRRWFAEIVVNRENIILGYFDTDVEAALAYDAAARKHFGQFAFTNFPEVA